MLFERRQDDHLNLLFCADDSIVRLNTGWNKRNREDKGKKSGQRIRVCLLSGWRVVEPQLCDSWWRIQLWLPFWVFTVFPTPFPSPFPWPFGKSCLFQRADMDVGRVVKNVCNEVTNGQVFSRIYWRKLACKDKPLDNTSCGEELT